MNAAVRPKVTPASPRELFGRFVTSGEILYRFNGTVMECEILRIVSGSAFKTGMGKYTYIVQKAEMG